MSPTLYILFALLSTPASPAPGDTIRAGLHPAETLLVAWERVTGQPLLRDTGIGARIVAVERPFELSPASQVSVAVILRRCGVHVVPHGDRTGTRYWFATHDRDRRPQRTPQFHVEVLAIRYTDPATAARFLNDLVAHREAHLDESQRTVFSAVTATKRIVARVRRGASLKPYKTLLADLDAPPEDLRRETIRSWRTRYRFAADLRRDFLVAWREQGAPEISIVVQKQSNTLLLRLPKDRWEAARKLLETLDQRTR